ncbi:MAG: DUF1643 domain-containing protein [Melioribacteraceae bacterium]|nr:DUF1643 domain-containing protein [Melioribacteraceae bacterium]
MFWESNDNYRHWCLQKHPQNKKLVLVVLFNPGSLSFDGANLSKDTTLRILRYAFINSGLNPLVINLFDYATPKRHLLFANWDLRDYKLLVYEKLLSFDIYGILYAFGNIDEDKKYMGLIESRIQKIKSIYSNVPEINLSIKSKHPIRWQIEKKIKVINKELISFYKNGL